jgi:deazaflavin-dependent oxidoreductase (nitroreductase family)
MSGNNPNEFPPEVLEAFAQHHKQYHEDPDAAHMWDPIVIGVPGGAVPCLLLFHRGRKSGRALESVLQYYKRGEEIAIVASKGGMPNHPVWYLNLEAAPDCEMQIASERRRVRARTVSGVERAAWWQLITAEQPQQLEYEQRTSREIPVVVLDPLN